jgi:hypothetical protein
MGAIGLISCRRGPDHNAGGASVVHASAKAAGLANPRNPSTRPQGKPFQVGPATRLGGDLSVGGSATRPALTRQVGSPMRAATLPPLCSKASFARRWETPPRGPPRTSSTTRSIELEGPPFSLGPIPNSRVSGRSIHPACSTAGHAVGDDRAAGSRCVDELGIERDH